MKFGQERKEIWGNTRAQHGRLRVDFP